MSEFAHGWLAATAFIAALHVIRFFVCFTGPGFAMFRRVSPLWLLHGRDFEPVDLLAKARRVLRETNEGT